jgi:hypothetical protein
MALPLIGVFAGSMLGRVVGGFLVNSMLQHAVRAHQQMMRAALAAEAAGIIKGVMSTFRVTVDSRATYAFLNDTQRRKIPRCTAIALTRTAKELQKLLEAEVVKVFDKPVSFTKRAFAIRPATYNNLASEVFIKTAQAKYLAPQVTGGRRQPKRSEQRFSADGQAPGMYWVPGEGVRLNTHGNLTLAQVKKIAERLRRDRRGVFIGQPRGTRGLPFGIWERIAGSLRPLLIQVRDPSYQPRLDMHGLAAKRAQDIFDREFARAWREIMR